METFKFDRVLFTRLSVCIWILFVCSCWNKEIESHKDFAVKHGSQKISWLEDGGQINQLFYDYSPSKSEAKLQQTITFYDIGSVFSLKVISGEGADEYLENFIGYSQSGEIISSVTNGKGIEVEVDLNSGSVLSASEIFNGKYSGFYIEYYDGKVTNFREVKLGRLKGHRVKMSESRYKVSSVEYFDDEGLAFKSISKNGDEKILVGEGFRPKIFTQGISGLVYDVDSRRVVNANFLIDKGLNLTVKMEGEALTHENSSADIKQEKQKSIKGPPL